MLVTRLSSQANRTAGRLTQQGDALLAAVIDWPNLFEGKASGARSDQSALVAALDYARAGDYLTVSKLDRLVRCWPHLSTLDRRDDSTPQSAFLFRAFSPSGLLRTLRSRIGGVVAGAVGLCLGPAVIGRQHVLSAYGHGDGGTLPGAKPPRLHQRLKDGQFSRMADAHLGNSAGFNRQGEPLVLIGVSTGNLLGDVIGDHEVVRVVGNEFHAVDAKEIDQHRSI